MRGDEDEPPHCAGESWETVVNRRVASMIGEPEQTVSLRREAMLTFRLSLLFALVFSCVVLAQASVGWAQLRALTAALHRNLGMAVADIGAGTGVFLELFAQAIGPQGRLSALAIAPKCIDHLRHRATTAGLTQGSAILGHERRVPVSESTVDLAFGCDTSHHVEYPQPMLTSIHRALRPGGTRVVIDFERIPEPSRPWGLAHLRADQATFTKELVAAGFRLVEEVTIPGCKEHSFLRFTTL
jgi:SAM-dependent methyltransferase